MFRHVVLFRIHDGVPPDAIDEALANIRELVSATATVGEVCLSEDARKGTVIVEDLTFESRTDFERFRAHPVHRTASDQMKGISDWLIADWESSLA